MGSIVFIYLAKSSVLSLVGDGEADVSDDDEEELLGEGEAPEESELFSSLGEGEVAATVTDEHPASALTPRIPRPASTLRREAMRWVGW
ncbi:hypothetical protein [Rothia aeria]|uniref:hypothetical protein n=1 Tax=Rothia aeria TaxID=172042 RepID=UPI0028F16A47|nr:hypothetical protein [Rothia aeria]